MTHQKTTPYELVPALVITYNQKKILKQEIKVISEYNFILSINEKFFFHLFTCSLYLKEFVIGYLMSEDLIKCLADIISVDISYKDFMIYCSIFLNNSSIERIRLSKKIFYTSLEDIKKNDKKKYKKINHIPTISASKLYASFKQFLDQSGLHKMTHGVHSAALYSAQMDTIFMCDEISRHNAIDQIIGMSCIKKISLKNKILYFTGRISLKVVQKALSQGIPIIVSRSMPTSSSILLANEHNLILICRVFENNITVCAYHNDDSFINW